MPMHSYHVAARGCLSRVAANGADGDLLIQQPVAGQSRDVGTGRHSTGRRREWHGVKRILKRTVINAYCYGLIPAKAVSLIFKLFDLKHQ